MVLNLFLIAVNTNFVTRKSQNTKVRKQKKNFWVRTYKKRASKFKKFFNNWRCYLLHWTQNTIKFFVGKFFSTYELIDDLKTFSL